MKYLTHIIILFSFAFANGQTTLDSLLLKENNQSIPYITVDELLEKKKFLLLDSREQEEYDISHIENANFVGYDKFKLEKLKSILPKDKNEPIVVYCSLGIRSENIAEKLQKAGYTNVYNLYGGIFQWKNKDNPVIDTEGNETENIHAFDEDWSIWLKKGVKIYKKEKSTKDK